MNHHVRKQRDPWSPFCELKGCREQHIKNRPLITSLQYLTAVEVRDTVGRARYTKIGLRSKRQRTVAGRCRDLHKFRIFLELLRDNVIDQILATKF